jgi:hypothetical protein
MFTAMILACAIDINGNETCAVFASAYISTSMKECVEDLNIGSKYVEDSGWEIRAYECYDWIKKKGTSL